MELTPQLTPKLQPLRLSGVLATLEARHRPAADGPWMKRLSGYRRPELLVLADCGLKPLVDPAPSALYDVINERYAVGSVLATRNRAPTEWPDLFGHPLLASAGLDRLAHHAETLVITGRSFRAQGRQPGEQRMSEHATAKKGGEAIPYR